MNVSEPSIVLRNALHQLASDARRQASSVEMDSPHHSFYIGVMTAAEDQLHLVRAAHHDETWLARETPEFRDGYLKASNLVAATAGHTPLRFVLPQP